MKVSIQNIIGLMGLCILLSCTDLDPKLYSELTPETKFTSADANLGALIAELHKLRSLYERCNMAYARAYQCNQCSGSKIWSLG